MGALIGSRAMTPAEKQRRSRSLRWLREQKRLAAEAKALLDLFAGSDPERPVDIRTADLIRDGLSSANETAARIMAAFLAGLPDQLEALRRDLDELREAASPR